MTWWLPLAVQISFSLFPPSGVSSRLGRGPVTLFRQRSILVAGGLVYRPLHLIELVAAFERPHHQNAFPESRGFTGAKSPGFVSCLNGLGFSFFHFP